MATGKERRQQVTEVDGVADRPSRAVDIAAQEPHEAPYRRSGHREGKDAQGGEKAAPVVDDLGEKEEEAGEQRVGEHLADAVRRLGREDQGDCDEKEERRDGEACRRQVEGLVAAREADQEADEQEEADKLHHRDGLGRVGQHSLPRQRGDEQQKGSERVGEDQDQHQNRSKCHDRRQRRNRRDEGDESRQDGAGTTVQLPYGSLAVKL